MVVNDGIDMSEVVPLDSEAEEFNKHSVLEKKQLDVDEFLEYVGQFGKAQIILCTLFCIIIIPTTYQTLVMSFAGNEPPWRCSSTNVINTECTMNGTFSRGDDFYEKRCNMNRSSWEFTKPKSFSIVTEVRELIFC